MSGPAFRARVSQVLFLAFALPGGPSASQALLIFVSILGLTFFSRLAFLEQRETIKKGNGKGMGRQCRCCLFNDKKKTAGPRPAACTHFVVVGTDS